MRHWMVDPDNEERLLKVPPRVVKRIKAEAFAESVEAVKALEYDGDYCKVVHACDAITAIEALGGER